MPFVVREKKGNNYYLYLQHNIRVNGKVKRLFKIYLGPEEKIFEHGIKLNIEKTEIKTLEFGADVALYDIAQKINLVEVIDKFTDKNRDQGLLVGEYILLAAINRCIKPCSKNKLGKWFKNSILTKYFLIKPSVLNSQTYWNHFTYFNENIIHKIEIELNKIILEKYNLDLYCVLYDPTNFYTYIKDEHKKYAINNKIPRKGFSKEHRNNLNQINLSLFCLRGTGIPLMHEIYPGNSQDAGHFKNILPKFIDRMKFLTKNVKEITLVFDKGNNSKEAFNEIDKEELKFIASLRPSTQKDLIMTPIDRFTMIKLKNNRKEVGYYHVQKKIYGKIRDLYVVYDPRNFKKQKKRFEKKLWKRIREVNEFFGVKLNIKKWRDLENVRKKIKDVLKKEFYNTIINVEIEGEYGNLKIKLTIDEEVKKRYETKLGRSVIFTNCKNWDPELVIRTYRYQWVIEDTFKHLKCPDILRFRPINHYTDNSIIVHGLICILGLLLLSLLRLELNNNNYRASYLKIIENLKEIKLSCISSEGGKFKRYILNSMDSEPKKIYNKLKLKRYL